MDNINYRNEADSLINEELNRIIEELMGEPVIRNTQPRSDNTILTQTLREILIGYNENIRDYQDNVRMFLQLTASVQQDISLRNRRTTEYSQGQRRPTVHIPTQTENVNRNVPPQNVNESNARWLSFFLYPRRTQNNVLRSFNNPVPVTPTTVQIENATELISYSNSIEEINTNCPITLDEFQEGDQVRRIIHCGHLFKEAAFQNWFSGHVRCPVCRYDIRDYQPRSRTTISNLTTILNNYLQEYDGSSSFTDLSNNLIYQFEIPAHSYYDSSNNLIHLSTL